MAGCEFCPHGTGFECPVCKLKKNKLIRRRLGKSSSCFLMEKVLIAAGMMPWVEPKEEVNIIFDEVNNDK